ncbi:hypothetical protein TNCV_5115001 [Trichonephila clavipes]|nr:hypothetical protein TNCV_5115001 [Trichonephila clavipes]
MCFCLRKPDEDVDTTLLFPNSVAQGVCRSTYDGHRFCALARLISHTHSEELLICVSFNTLIHRRAAPTAHARTCVIFYNEKKPFLPPNDISVFAEEASQFAMNETTFEW